eukprot:637443-Pyramimonas_sp.AAC.2
MLPPNDLPDNDTVPVVVKLVGDLVSIHFGPQSSRAHLSLRNELSMLWQARPGGLQLDSVREFAVEVAT